MIKTNKASFSGAKSKLLNSLAAIVLITPGVAMAEEASPLSANVGFTTDYIFRGISQTSAKPAVQGGIDFAHASGFYAGVWGSNIRWITDFGATGSARIELDTYAGFKNAFAGDFNYDIGVIRYNYPGSYTPAAGTVKADTDEIYGAIGYKWVTAKYSHGLGKFLTVPGATGTNYIEINASIPVADTGLTFGAHLGKQTYRGAAASTLALAGFDPTYTDYKLSVSKDFSGYVIGFAYSDTNAPSGGFYTTPAGRNLARGAAVLSVTHSF